MLNVENRTPHPGKEGRVRLRQDNGQVIEGVLEMADDATSPGTPWNRQSGRLLQADIRTYPIADGQTIQAGDVVDVVDGEVVGNRKALSTFLAGDIVQLNENGSPVDYIVVNQRKPSSMYDDSCNGTWLMRKDIIIKRNFDSSRSNNLENSELQSWLDSDMYSKYDVSLQEVVKNVKIPYLSGGGNGTVKTGANGLPCKVFLLSGYELGWTSSTDWHFLADGAVLDYFSRVEDQKRIALFEGSAASWWTRSPVAVDEYRVFCVNSRGTYSQIDDADISNGVRPVIVVDSDAVFPSDKAKKSQAIALQSGTAGQSIEVIYSGTVAADWVTEGKVIESNGVYGVGVLGKVLQVWSKDRPWVVYGSFTATAKKSIHVNLGFEPSVVIMYAGANNDSGGVAFDSYNYNGYSAAYYFARVYTKAYFSLSNDNKITHDGFNFYASKADGGTDSRTVYYVAWR